MSLITITLYHKLKLEAFHASILSIDLAGKKEQVLLRDLQMHPYKLQVLHVDFQRVDQNKKDTYEGTFALYQC